MASISDAADKATSLLMIAGRSMVATFGLGILLLYLSTGFIPLWTLAPPAFGQPSSSLQETPLNQAEEAGNQFAELEAARQAYLSAWNTTDFMSQFDVFVAEGTDGGYGIYREHLPANVFRPGETIVLYLEPVGFGYQPFADTNREGASSEEPSRILYLINMTVDIIISDPRGSELQALEDLPGASFISHRQNTEFPLIVTLTQSQPFPVGDYVLSYVIHDQVTGQSFQMDRNITVDENAVTGAAPLPGGIPIT
ncbi:MAG TPA: hypothetical protein VJ695_07210 [Nitrososphaera sp.]|nr:hypothetical protein [Nitrososphaera sp.]